MSTLVSRLDHQQNNMIYEALASSTINHLEAEGSFFERLAFDPVTNQSQNLSTIYLPAVPTTVEQAEDLITKASPRLYPYLKERFTLQEDYISELSKKRSNYLYRGNVIHLNTHQSIEDVIALLAARSVVEHEARQIPWREIVGNNFTILSRGVSTLGAFGFPAPEAVTLGGHVYLSFPRTETILKLAQTLDLPGNITIEEIIEENNSRLREHLSDFMPGLTDIDTDTLPHPIAKRVGYIATSGTTDKVEGDKYSPEEITLQEASPALAKSVAGATIAPVVTWDRGEDKEPLLITGEFTTIRKYIDLQRVQEWHRKTLAKNLGIKDDKVTIKPLPTRQ